MFFITLRVPPPSHTSLCQSTPQNFPTAPINRDLRQTDGVLKIPAAPPHWAGSPQCSDKLAGNLPNVRKLFHCNSLANPAAPMSGISALLQQACGVSERCAFSKTLKGQITATGPYRYRLEEIVRASFQGKIIENLY